jgi:lysophospholipase L1-like esterase
MPKRQLKALWMLALVASLAAVGCGEDAPAAPTPPPVAQLTIACPPAQSGVSFQNQPVSITWPAPTTQGGTAPVQTSCAPASGSAFPPGTATVSCTATGAVPGQVAACSFAVTVTRPPQISVRRFMAFGDSITWGKESPASGFLAYPLPAPSISYPTQLLSALGARYPDQAITMANEGWPGEVTADGLNRLPSALATNAPEVLLLLHGANDLVGSPSDRTTDIIASRLRDMVRTAKSRIPTITVLLATFPPQYIGTPDWKGAGAPFVSALNQKIADVARSEGATLVDLYAPMSVDIKRYIGVDGLHPTEQGFTLMAQTFAKVIQETLEPKPTGSR